MLEPETDPMARERDGRAADRALIVRTMGCHVELTQANSDAFVSLTFPGFGATVLDTRCKLWRAMVSLATEAEVLRAKLGES